MMLIIVIIVTVTAMIKCALEEIEEDKNGSRKTTGNSKKTGK